LHFVLLARNYPELVDLFLDLCQRRPERQRKGTSKSDRRSAPPIHMAAPDDKNLPENVPNDVPNRIDTSSCNIRQLWFINALARDSQNGQTGYHRAKVGWSDRLPRHPPKRLLRTRA
jgi:hypothetical protein